MFFCGKPPVTSRSLSDRSSPTTSPKASTSPSETPSSSPLVTVLEEGIGYLFSTLCTSPEEKYGNEENGEDHRKKSKEAGEGEKKSTPKG